jgi:hypothetical protein
MDATPIRDHDELVALVRRRQDELGVACVTIDQVAGLADGHFAKLTCGIKRFGPVSIFLVLSALGLPRNENYAANAYKRGGLRAALLAAPARKQSPWAVLLSPTNDHWRRAG